MHTIDSLRIAGIALEHITDVFLTHLHGDHFQAANLEKIAAAKSDVLRVWVAGEAKLPKIENTLIIRMPKLAAAEIDSGVYITGLYANHDENYFPQHLLFEIDGKRILYATDGGWVLNKSYNFLRQLNRPLDMLVLDCTSGESGWEYGIGDHNGIPMIRLLIPSFRKVKIIDGETKVYITHIAPSHHKPHDEIVKTMKEVGVLVAYDGLEETIG